MGDILAGPALAGTIGTEAATADFLRAGARDGAAGAGAGTEATGAGAVAFLRTGARGLGVGAARRRCDCSSIAIKRLRSSWL